MCCARRSQGSLPWRSRQVRVGSGVSIEACTRFEILWVLPRLAVLACIWVNENHWLMMCACIRCKASLSAYGMGRSSRRCRMCGRGMASGSGRRRFASPDTGEVNSGHPGPRPSGVPPSSARGFFAPARSWASKAVGGAARRRIRARHGLAPTSLQCASGFGRVPRCPSTPGFDQVLARARRVDAQSKSENATRCLGRR